MAFLVLFTACRLQEENRRLRDALQAASKKAERGDRAQEVLSKSEVCANAVRLARGMQDLHMLRRSMWAKKNAGT